MLLLKDSRLPLTQTFRGKRKRLSYPKFELLRVKLYKNGPKGNENYVELAGGWSYWESTVIAFHVTSYFRPFLSILRLKTCFAEHSTVSYKLTAVLYLSLAGETGDWRASLACSPGDCSRLAASCVGLLRFLLTVDPLIPLGGLLGGVGGGVNTGSATL